MRTVWEWKLDKDTVISWTYVFLTDSLDNLGVVEYGFDEATKSNQIAASDAAEFIAYFVLSHNIKTGTP